MKRLKVLLASLLAVFMILSIAACGGTTQTQTQTTPSAEQTSTQASAPAAASTEAVATAPAAPDKDADTGLVPMAKRDPVTFKVFVRDPSTAPSKDNPVLKKITELTGVTIDYEFLVGDLMQKIGVMIAGEDYPDAIFAGDSNSKFVDAGAFIPLQDKIPNYPNLNKLYAPHKAELTAKDGNQYIMEIYMSNNPAPTFDNGGAGFFMQKAVIEAGNYAIPKTIDEYFKLIEDYLAKNPTIDGVKTKGFEILCDGWRDFCLRNPAQHLMGASNDGDVFVDQSTLTASCYQVSDTAKSYYKKLNEEFHKGVIEAETFTQNYDQYISRLSTGAVLAMFDQRWDFGSAENVLKTDKKYNRTFAPVPIANPGVKDSYLDAPNGVIGGINGIGITKKCKDPDRLLAFYDWLLQQDVQIYLQWGQEGKDYTVVNGNSRVLTQERRDLNADTAKARDLTGTTLWNYSPKMQGLFDDGSPCGPGDSVDEYKAGLKEYDQKFLQACKIDFPAQLLSAPVKRPKYYPVWAMVIEDGSPAKTANTKFNDVSRKYLPRLIMAKASDFDSLWDKYVKEFNSCNPQAYLDEVNRQIKEKMSK